MGSNEPEFTRKAIDELIQHNFIVYTFYKKFFELSELNNETWETFLIACVVMLAKQNNMQMKQIEEIYTKGLPPVQIEFSLDNFSKQEQVMIFESLKSLSQKDE
jgi:hypothetical protein